MANRYLPVVADGFRFLFAYDEGDPELLHIYARHLATVEDALRVWFDEDTADTWDSPHQRWESAGRSHVLYWKYLDDETILVISCFRREA